MRKGFSIMDKKYRSGVLRELKESIPAYLLILPTIAVFIVFLYIPFFNALRISMYRYKGYGDLTDFIGLNNYKTILSDAKYYSAFFNTFKLIGFDLIFSITIGFLLAYILFKGIKLKGFFSTSLFIPYLISMVVVGCIWRIIYDPTIGPLNQFLGIIGLDNLKNAWLSQPSTAMSSIIVTWIWRTIPFNMLIIYANIMTLPPDYLEAADIDGANSLQKLRYIILPYLIPAFLQLSMLTVTNDLRVFDLVWIMTGGGPGGATEVMTSYIYRQAFISQRFGTASASSVIMMIFMIALTVFFRIFNKKEG